MKKKEKFELDLNYDSEFPIGMDPKKSRHFDNHELYFQFLNNWKPNNMPKGGKEKIKSNPTKVCVTLS